MSIYLAQSNELSTLAEIIAAADATNHAIPTPNELSQAFTKLVSAGILSIDNHTYRLKNEYLHEIETAYRSKGGLFETGKKGQKWLTASKLEPNEAQKVTITRDEVNRAYKVYTSRIKRKG